MAHHLLCVVCLSVTPAGKRGLIVRKEWILDCHVKKKRLPAKHYRLSAGAGDTSSSEDDWYDARDQQTCPRKAGEEQGSGQDAGGQGSSAAGEGMAGGKRSDAAKAKEAAPCEGQRSLEGVETGVEKEEAEDPYGASTDEGEMAEDPYGASTDEGELGEGEGEEGLVNFLSD